MDVRRDSQMMRIRRGSRAIIEHLLENLAAPSFVIDTAGKVLEASTSGKVFYRANPREIARRLAAAIRGESAHFTTSRIAESGAPRYYVAAARETADARVNHAITNATAHWSLTARQRDVLTMLVHGATRTTIAMELDISSRAVDLHMARLFGKASVDSQRSLVTVVMADVR